MVHFAAVGLGLSGRDEAVTLPAEEAGRGPGSAVISIEGGSAVVEVDDLSEASESEPNDERARATPLPVPGVGDGRVGREGDVDLWALALQEGSVLRAGRPGGPARFRTSTPS